MSETTVDIGDLVRIDRTFLNAAGEAADPSTVVLYLLSPSGEASTPTVVDDAGAGAYHVDVTPDEPGLWRYRWATTGDPQVNDEGSFRVRRRRVPEPEA